MNKFVPLILRIGSVYLKPQLDCSVHRINCNPHTEFFTGAISHGQGVGGGEAKSYDSEETLVLFFCISYLCTYDLNAPYVMFLMRADPLRGQVGEGEMASSRQASAIWGQKSPPPPPSQGLRIQPLIQRLSFGLLFLNGRNPSTMPENSFYIALAISVLFCLCFGNTLFIIFIFYRCRDMQYFAAVNVLNG